jgi:protein gp37
LHGKFDTFVHIHAVQSRLEQPLRCKRPWKIFVHSMSDLFHEDVPPDDIARVGDVMRRAGWHVFQVLTKRDERLRELLRGELRWMADLDHVAFGVSVEDRQYGLTHSFASGQASPNSSGIDSVIVGGETGTHARPMLREWVVEIRRQCRVQRVPFFFKQIGSSTGRFSRSSMN